MGGDMCVYKPCRLCGSIDGLCESHIVPAFVFRWQKRTSSTGYLRFGEQVNQRVQDGFKVPFLCRDCEGRFNSWETKCANEFFLPYHKRGQTTFTYDIWMAKFCVSVSWRVLAYLRAAGDTNDLESQYGEDVDAAMSVWADFLLDKRQDVDRFEQHLLPFGAIGGVTVELPSNIQRYLMRAVEFHHLWNNQSACVVTKMGHIILIGFLREPEADSWEGTRLQVGAGTLSPTTLVIPDWFGKHLVDRAEHLAKVESTISPRQHNIVDRTQQSNSGKVLQSETLRALMEDHRLQDEMAPDNGSADDAK